MGKKRIPIEGNSDAQELLDKLQDIIDNAEVEDLVLSQILFDLNELLRDY